MEKNLKVSRDSGEFRKALRFAPLRGLASGAPEKLDTHTEGKDKMKRLYAIRKPENSARKLWYRNLSLVKLVEKIVGKSDRPALEEFHNHRTLFSYKERPPLLFIDYLKELRESTARRTWIAPNALEVADKAYDLTIDKFSNLPGIKKSSQKAKSKGSQKMKHKGADCRLYFKAFLGGVVNSLKTNPPANEIEEESRAAMIMQGLVKRHFYLSLLEAKRSSNPFWSRYYWRVKRDTICVWLPVSLGGRERQKWLVKNIDKPNPRREGERERIQSIIDQKLVKERFVPLEKATGFSNEEELQYQSDSGETFGISLAEAVAEEKAENIGQQRPSIRALGEERLKHLVLRIFNDMSSDEYEDGKVARDFGLSKATFSRFAGSKWLSTESIIPDLWLNTAEVLSTHPTFKEVAISTGVWKQVQTILEMGAPRCREETSHD